MKNYRTGKTGTYRETFKMTDAGTYHVAVWTTGWNFQTSKKITVEPTPVISGNKRVGVGMNATFNISGIKSSLEFGIFPGNDDGSIKSYSVSNYAAVKPPGVDIRTGKLCCGGMGKRLELCSAVPVQGVRFG